MYQRETEAGARERDHKSVGGALGNVSGRSKAARQERDCPRGHAADPGKGQNLPLKLLYLTS